VGSIGLSPCCSVMCLSLILPVPTDRIWLGESLHPSGTPWQ
jgi:hypothetical protein